MSALQHVSTSHFRDYDKAWIHREMLFDDVRVQAYADALSASIIPGKSTVMEFGCGTGIMSMLAAKSQARHVYGIELSETAIVAQQMVKANDLQNNVTIIQADASTVVIPKAEQQIDILVSEWMGGLAVDENFIPPLIQCRNRFLNPNTGIMIPSRARGYACLALDTRLEKIINTWTHHIPQKYNLCMSQIYDRHCNEVLNARHHVKQEHLLGDVQLLFDLDMKTIQPSDGNFSVKFEYRVEKDSSNDETSKFNCIAAWFECDMDHGGKIKLTNSPDLSCPDTHWGRTVFPLGEVITCQEGDFFEIELESRDSGNMKCTQTWSIIGWKEHDSSRFAPFINRKFSGTQTPTQSPGFH